MEYPHILLRKCTLVLKYTKDREIAHLFSKNRQPMFVHLLERKQSEYAMAK